MERAMPNSPIAPRTLARAVRIACLSSVFLVAGQVLAADGASGDDAETRYREQRALCESGLSPQDRASCLQEAAAALNEARSGRLAGNTGNVADDRFQRNALARCQPLPEADRAACEARMTGEGTTRGSLESGGIYRELTIRETLEPGSASRGSAAGGAAPAVTSPVPPRGQVAPIPPALAPGDRTDTSAAASDRIRSPGTTTAPGAYTGPGQPTRPGQMTAPGVSVPPGRSTPPGMAIPPGSTIPPHGTMPPRDTMTPQGSPRPPMPGVVPPDPVPGDRVAPRSLSPQPLSPRPPLPSGSIQREMPPPELAPADTRSSTVAPGGMRTPEALPRGAASGNE
jgi:hypothetical protein